MIIGVPRETKDHEYRVALTPQGSRRLASEGHKVLVEKAAGAGSGFTDEEYAASGAKLVERPEDAYSAELVVKVKEPQEPEYAYLRPGLVLFTYLHLAAAPELAKAMLKKKVTGIAYETVQLPSGTLPLLTPMSEVAGRLSIQAGAHYLEKAQGGRGVLLSGVPGVPPARVVIIGAGTVGGNAAAIALGMGARVTLINLGLDRLRYLSEVLKGNLETVASTPEAIAEAVEQADLLVGAVLLPGARTPRVVTREMVRSMPKGSVIVDVSVDQGGCVETTRPTTHSDPVYDAEGVMHYCVTNMPGAVPRTSTQALANATLPYIVQIARHGAVEAMRKDKALAHGLNTFKGHVTHPALAESLDLPVARFEELV